MQRGKAKVRSHITALLERALALLHRWAQLLRANSGRAWTTMHKRHKNNLRVRVQIHHSYVATKPRTASGAFSALEAGHRLIHGLESLILTSVPQTTASEP